MNTALPYGLRKIQAMETNLTTGVGAFLPFAAKEEIVSIALGTDDDIIVIDPENEYSGLVSMLGGEIVEISASSMHHIHAMDMVQGYGDAASLIALKSENDLPPVKRTIKKYKISFGVPLA